MRKGMRRTAVGLLAVLGVAVAALAYAFRAPLPAQAGVRELAGLVATVQVEFDRLAIPRIKAANRADAFHALGFVTAGDRLFQMDLLRRQTAGRLAEVFGEEFLEEDRWNRVMGFGQLAGVILSRLPAEERQLIEAYTTGVNQAMAAANLFAIEFTLLGYRPELWRPEDSILVILTMHAMLSWSGDQERTASVMRKALPRSVVDFLTPESDCYNERLAPRNPGRCAADPLPLADLIAVLQEAKGAGDVGTRVVSASGSPRGSNAWVVGPAKTRDGRAILANDMHLQLSVPNTWYRAELHYPGADLSGLTLPGVPSLIVGTNGHIAWGVTSVEGDFVDLVMIEEDAKDPGQYRSPTGNLPFETRTEHIHVRGGADETLRARTTVWGPVLPDPLLGRPVAVHWTALDPAANDLGLADLAEVTTVTAAITRMHRIGGPHLNVLLADSAGDIAWTYVGKIPRRVGMDGLFSESWSDGRKGWDGYIPPEEMPSIVNPPSGFLVNANQRMLGADYSIVIGHDFSGGYRAWRIWERLNQLQGVGETDMLALQLDTETEFFRYYQKLALRALEGEDVLGEFSAGELRRYLEAWDGRAETMSQGIALLVEFREELVEAVLAPLLTKCREIDPAFSYNWSGVDVPVQRVIESGRDELVPVRRSFPDWHGFLREILLRSAQKLMKRQGVMHLGDVTWGKVNKVDVRHPLSEAVIALGMLLDMPRLALPGCGHCVRFADGKYGASERMVVAPGRENEGILHMPGGQSGHPGSRHYSDQQESWAKGLPTKFVDDDIVHRLTLRPQLSTGMENG